MESTYNTVRLRQLANEPTLPVKLLFSSLLQVNYVTLEIDHQNHSAEDSDSQQRTTKLRGRFSYNIFKFCSWLSSSGIGPEISLFERSLHNQKKKRQYRFRAGM